MVRGQGLAKLMTKSNYEVTQVNNVEGWDGVVYNIDHTLWYTNIVYFLITEKCPDGMSENQKRTLELQASKYVLVKGDLFCKDKDGVLLLCLDEVRDGIILREIQEGVCGEHFSTKTQKRKE